MDLKQGKECAQKQNMSVTTRQIDTVLSKRGKHACN